MVRAMDAVLSAELWDISVLALGLALLYILVGFVLGRLVELFFEKLKKSVPEYGVRRGIVGAIDRPAGWCVRVGGIWLAINQMPLGNIEAFDVDRFVNQMLVATSVALATWLGARIVDRLCAYWARKASQTDTTFDDQLVPIVRKTAKVFMVVTGAVMVMQNLGYSVGSLLAGLGIGGAALAFASKDTIANFFGSVVIFLDRPFQMGDWIEVGGVEGTVEEVGVRVTTIRTFANSLITMPNAQFTTTAINNWSRMKRRRIKLTIGVTYDANPEQLHQAVQAIRDVIRSDDRLDQSFYLVNFFDFGPHSLDIFCYLFTRTINWAEHMQIREEFLLKVMTAIQGLGLSFAFPTQSIHLESVPKNFAANQPPGAPKAMMRETPL
jgi:MscS family membrane protein